VHRENEIVQDSKKVAVGRGDEMTLKSAKNVQFQWNCAEPSTFTGKTFAQKLHQRVCRATSVKSTYYAF